MSVLIKSLRDRPSSTAILSSASQSRSATWIVTWYPFATRAPSKRADAQGAGLKDPISAGLETWVEASHLGGLVRRGPEDVGPQLVTRNRAFGGCFNGSAVLCRNALTSTPIAYNRGALTNGRS